MLYSRYYFEPYHCWYKMPISLCPCVARGAETIDLLHTTRITVSPMIQTKIKKLIIVFFLVIISVVVILFVVIGPSSNNGTNNGTIGESERPTEGGHPQHEERGNEGPDLSKPDDKPVDRGVHVQAL
jgi:hypothetical protein